MKVKGQVMKWHVMSPPILELLMNAEIREQVCRHIFTVMGYYCGRIQVWNVVNKALSLDSALASTTFYKEFDSDKGGELFWGFGINGT